MIDWEKSGRGDLADLNARIGPRDEGTRGGVRAELTKWEEEIAQGRTTEVQKGKKGPDWPDLEVKARTEPFIDENDAQKRFNNRIEAATAQVGGVRAAKPVLCLILATVRGLEGSRLTRCRAS